MHVTQRQHSQISSPSYSPNLDVLRAIAVLSVLFHHTHAIKLFEFPFLGEYGGMFGVQLFFIISGYLIVESAQKYSLKEYLFHRIFRIFPAYLLVYLLAGWKFGVLSKLSSDNFFYFLLNLLNLQQLHPKALIEWNVLNVTWTLTIELIWYAIAPLVVLCFPRQRIVLFLLISLVISSTWAYLADKNYLYPFYQPLFATLDKPAEAGQILILVQNAFPSQLVFFALGATIFYYKEYIPRINSSILSMSVVLFIFLFSTYGPYIPQPTFLTGLGVLAVFCIAIKAPPSKDWLLIRIGKISYSVYLIHLGVMIWMKFRFPEMNALQFTLIAYLLIFVASNLLYELVEKRFIRFGKNLSRKH